MTEHSDTANTAQPASVDWGLDIRCDGKRPDGLEPDQPLMMARGAFTWYNPGTEKRITELNARWDQISYIRLPVDHPYYRGQREATNTVTIPRMTEAEARKFLNTQITTHHDKVEFAMNGLRAFGFIVPDPSPATLLSQHCNITEEQAAKALAWVAENVK